VRNSDGLALAAQCDNPVLFRPVVRTTLCTAEVEYDAMHAFRGQLRQHIRLATAQLNLPMPGCESGAGIQRRYRFPVGIGLHELQNRCEIVKRVLKRSASQCPRAQSGQGLTRTTRTCVAVLDPLRFIEDDNAPRPATRAAVPVIAVV